ncbi:MAG: CAP domain-containing protein [Chloroflexota bacterium]
MRRQFYICIVCSLFASLWLAGCRGDESAPQPVMPESTDTPVTERPTLPPPAVAAVASATLPPTEPPPTALPTPTTTAESTVTPPPPATNTPVPPPTEPPPTPTAEAIYPAWLNYLNRFRTMGGLAPLSEQAALTLGSELHSQYMVVNDAAVSHEEDPGNPFYNEAGDQAARNGNVFATSMVEADYVWGINFWASAPFHLVPMLSPRLERVGFGDYNEAGGSVGMAAVLDVRSERNTGTTAPGYPLLFPGDGSTTWIGRHNLFEWPDPLTSCPGYARPSGPPIVIQLGDGDIVPIVGGHALLMGDTPVDTCLFDETTYTNPDIWAEKTGRQILDNQDAIVIIPRSPLVAGETYTAQVEVNGQRYTWQFNAVASPDEVPSN